MTLSANALFAAPDTALTLVVSSGEIGRGSGASAILSVDLAAPFIGSVVKIASLVKARGTATVTLSHIEIVQGTHLTIRQGQDVNLTAIGYLSNGRRIAGVNFDWTIAETGNNRAERNLPNGNFAARLAGNFVIKAKARGVEAMVNLTVEPDEGWPIMERIRRDRENGDLTYIRELEAQHLLREGEISSRVNYSNVRNPLDVGNPQTVSLDSERTKQHGPSADPGNSVPESEPIQPGGSSKSMMRPADEDGWGPGNWWMADDPGNQVGNPPGTTPEAAGNGNFQLSAPVASLPGRGIDISLSLNYNSRVWSKAGNTMSFDAERGFPAPGWNLGFGKLIELGYTGGCMLVDADGTNHSFTGSINYYTGTYGFIDFAGHTTDGSFIDYSCHVSTYNGAATATTGYASLPNGTQISYTVSSANKTQSFPTQIVDAQGNYTTVTYRNNAGPQLNTVTDTLGRVINFNYDSLDRLISVDTPKLDDAGIRTAVQFHYKQLALSSGWQYPVTGDTNNANPYVIDAIYYPGTQTGYWFGADSAAPDYSSYYSSYGMVVKVVEQRGMGWTGTAGTQGTVTAGTMSKQAEYDYPMSPIYTISDAPTYTTLTESWAGMDTAPSVTSYSINMNAFPRTITVTRPNGVKSKQYMYNASSLWNDGLIYQDETLDPSNNQLSKSVVTWQQGSYDSPRPSETNITDEKLQVLKTTYTYGTVYNQLTSQKKYDYDGTTLLQEARKSYENGASYTGRHIFNLVTSSESYDGSGNRVAKADYEYDGSSLSPTPGVVQHLSSYDPSNSSTQPCNCHWSCDFLLAPKGDKDTSKDGTGAQTDSVENCPDGSPPGWVCDSCPVFNSQTNYRGNLTKITSYAEAQGLTGAPPVVQTKEYDITGNVVKESASCCELKTYVYDDPNTTAIDTQYAYPMIMTRGSSDPSSSVRNTSSAVYDFNTGLLKQVVDPDGNTSATTYNADTLRPTQSTSSTGAYSTTSYNESAMTITDETHEYGGALAGKTITYLNGVGQTVKTESVGPGGVTDIVESKYNNLAEPWKQSRPYRTGDTVQWSEKFYDMQGRLTKVVEPDGSETKAFYNETTRPSSASTSAGRTIRVMDAWGLERWGRYDALDRLGEVVEPNPNGDGTVAYTGQLGNQLHL